MIHFGHSCTQVQELVKELIAENIPPLSHLMNLEKNMLCTILLCGIRSICDDNEAFTFTE